MFYYALEELRLYTRVVAPLNLKFRKRVSQVQTYQQHPKLDLSRHVAAKFSNGRSLEAKNLIQKCNGAETKMESRINEKGWLLLLLLLLLLLVLLLLLSLLLLLTAYLFWYGPMSYTINMVYLHSPFPYSFSSTQVPLVRGLFDLNFSYHTSKTEDPSPGHT